MKIYIKTLDEYIEVSAEGRFVLPQREYTAAELKKISTEVNKASRNLHLIEQEDFK